MAPPALESSASFAQSRSSSRGQHSAAAASLCETKWVGPRMTWAGEEREREIVSLTSTSSHGRRLPTPHHLTRVLPPACHGRRRPSLLPFALLSEASAGVARLALAGVALFGREYLLERGGAAWPSTRLLHSLVSFGPLPLAWLPSGGRHSDKPRWVPFLSLSHTACLGSPALPLLECSRALSLCSFSCSD